MAKQFTLGLFLLMATPAFSQTCTDTIIIDFENLKTVDATIHSIVPGIFDDDGAELRAVALGNVQPYFNYAGTLSPVFAGSTMLMVSQDEIKLARPNGGLFDLLSIILAEVPSFGVGGAVLVQDPTPVTFTGIKENGRTVSFTAIIQPFPEVTTVQFKGFSRLRSVSWFQQIPGPMGHQFDNIIVRLD